ncbi:MAG TPA: hypothetical protein VJZ94_02735 [Candidatus Paceibacterota bacterium]|nr:hypothetical protein [Candidatus Paceibacterota bacterium]
MVKLEKRKGLAEAGPFEHPKMLYERKNYLRLQPKTSSRGLVFLASPRNAAEMQSSATVGP